MAVLSVLQFHKLTINPSFDDYIPKEVSNRVYLDKLDSLFGGNEKIMLILTSSGNIINRQSYDRLQSLTRELEKLEGVEGCLSIANIIDIKQEEGFTMLEPLIDEIPEEADELEALKQRILNSKMGQRLVSADLSAMAILLTKSDSVEDREIILAIEAVIEQNPGSEEVFIGGLSFIRYSISQSIKKDLRILLPLALLLMIVMLYFSFREWKGVVLPFIVVVLSILFAFGLMAILHWEISIVTILLPIILIAIANDYGIHLINLYQEKSRLGEDANNTQIVISVYRQLKRPIILTALTTIGGILGLLSHKMAPAAQLGVLGSLGIGLALLLSLYMIPVLLTFYKLRPTLKDRGIRKRSPIAIVLSIFSRWAITYPRRVMAGFAVIMIISTAGLFLINVDTNVEGYFPPKSEVKKGIDLINQKFGGSQYISVVFGGDVLSPASLARMDDYSREMEKLPEVGHVISPGMFLRELSKGMYLPGEAGYDALPASENEAVQYLEVSAMGGYQDQISQIIDYNYNNARILVSMKDGSNQTGKVILEALRNLTRNDDQVKYIAGPGLSKIQIADMVVEGQIKSLVWAFAIILVLLIIIFRSISVGIKSILPLIISTLFLFGTMGWWGIPLDIVTALLSSIMIGAGIDYTIHFLWRYKLEYARLRNIAQAITTTLNTAGRGIVFNAFSVMVGFSVLILSSFAPIRFFGLLVVISIFACLISALLFIPALINLTKSKSLEP